MEQRWHHALVPARNLSFTDLRELAIRMHVSQNRVDSALTRDDLRALIADAENRQACIKEGPPARLQLAQEDVRAARLSREAKLRSLGPKTMSHSQLALHTQGDAATQYPSAEVAGSRHWSANVAVAVEGMIQLPARQFMALQRALQQHDWEGFRGAMELLSSRPLHFDDVPYCVTACAELGSLTGQTLSAVYLGSRQPAAISIATAIEQAMGAQAAEFTELVVTNGCPLECQVVQLSPYFTVYDLAKFQQIWQQDYAAFAHKSDCCHYAFTFSEDGTKAHCREAYWDADALNQHIDDVGSGPFSACLDPSVAELDHLEVHGPAEQLKKVKAGPHGGLPWTYYTTEWGFRPARTSMKQDSVCHLYPYFKLNDVAAFKKIWKDAYADTKANAEAEKSHQYAFSFSTDANGQTTACCRESYADGASLKLHIDNVLGPFGACLAPEIAELDHIEIHAPAAELQTIKQHGALQANLAKMQYSVIGWGFRNRC